MGAGNRGDLGVERSNRPSNEPPPGADRRVGTRGGTIEGEDAALEIFSEK